MMELRRVQVCDPDLGDLVVDPKIIRNHYLKSWFTIDLSSCFPGNYISYALNDEGGSNTSKMIRLLRMLRLLRLYPHHTGPGRRRHDATVETKWPHSFGKRDGNF